MKAIILKKFGAVENLVIQEIPTPIIKKDEVLVRVRAISINPVDVKTRAGFALAENLKMYNPIILGWDVSGEVVEIGDNVQEFKVGDNVFGMVNFVGHGKAYAEYVAVPTAQLALKPENISHEEAAAATLAALTAWQAFTQNGRVRVGDRVLIHAVSGGVGHYAVQIAKYLGAYVVGTSSLVNKDFALSLGTDKHIDYRNQKFEEVVDNIDFVLETIGGDNFLRSVNVLKEGGIIVNLPSGLTEKDKEAAKAKKAKAVFFMMVESNGDDMKMIASLLEKSIIKSHISKVFSFDEMAQAHLQLQTKRTVGKVVVSL